MFRKFTVMKSTFLVLCLSCCPISGQDDELVLNSATIRMTQATESSEFNRIVFLADTDLSGEMGYYIQGYPVNQSWTDLLKNRNLQKQIDWSREQQSQYGEIQTKLRVGLQEISERYTHRNDPKIAPELRNQFTNKYKEEVGKFRDRIEKEIKETLVPQQVKLIKQYQFNQSVRLFGFARTVSKSPFSEQIKTTKEQAEKLKQIKKEAEEEIKKAIEEIKSKAKAKMLKEFDRKQRERIRELEGDKKKSKTISRL